MTIIMKTFTGKTIDLDNFTKDDKPLSFDQGVRDIYIDNYFEYGDFEDESFDDFIELDRPSDNGEYKTYGSRAKQV